MDTVFFVMRRANRKDLARFKTPLERAQKENQNG
jgi:hypothetical protein